MTDTSLRSGFLASAARMPDAVALVFGGREYSYAELNRLARTWAAALVDVAGVRPQRVAVYGARSEVSYAGALAALVCGATYVPLNPKFPASRTRDMLRMADVDAVVVDAKGRAQLETILNGLERAPKILVSDDVRGVTPLEDLPAVASDDVAYLLFTSGTTGAPKGVPVTHANVRHFIDVVSRRYGITADDRFSQTFDQTFDLSMFDLFVAWQAGARVCVPEPIDLVAPTAFVRRHQLTVWFSVPSVVTLMRRKNVLTAGSLPSLRWSLFCGEALPRASAEAWQEAAPNSTVENLYGPTELTIACLVHRWDRVASPALCVNDIVAIGRPFEGLEAVVVDERLTPVAPEESGELCVSGSQTSPGYWRDPSRTRERFVQLPDRPESGRFYRTGDRVRQTAGGEFVYLGRVDEQIKVRGYRVEPAEIEAVLRRDAPAAEIVAIGWPEESGSALGIVAFASGKDLDIAALGRAAECALPDYMRPSEFLAVDEFPLNANGKVDRPALRQRLDERAAVLSLQRQASEPYSAFVFDGPSDAEWFWRLLVDRGVAEFSPPYGRLARENGRIVGLVAALSRRDLQARRLRSAAELAKTDFFDRHPRAQRRIQLASRALFPIQNGDHYLSRLAVVADARGTGVGARLLEECVAEGRREGSTRLVLEVSSDNPGARRFYERHGFEEAGRGSAVDEDTGRRLEYVHMTKTLG